MPEDKIRIFISYARKDGRELALKLHASLEADGYDHKGNSYFKAELDVGDSVRSLNSETLGLTGKVKEITEEEFILENASWIADSGRFMNAINDGELDEVEPVNSNVGIMKESIVDFCEWNHDLPRKQK